MTDQKFGDLPIFNLISEISKSGHWQYVYSKGKCCSLMKPVSLSENQFSTESLRSLKYVEMSIFRHFSIANELISFKEPDLNYRQYNRKFWK